MSTRCWEASSTNITQLLKRQVSEFYLARKSEKYYRFKFCGKIVAHEHTEKINSTKSNANKFSFETL